MMQIVEVDFGFSVADADTPEVRFAAGDLVLVFTDWRERTIEHRFVDALAFRWGTRPSHPTPRDDSAFEVLASEWLDAELRQEGGLAAEDHAHYILCFNATRALEVICRRTTKQGRQAP
jgi:hypothetical protein